VTPAINGVFRPLFGVIFLDRTLRSGSWLFPLFFCRCWSVDLLFFRRMGLGWWRIGRPARFGMPGGILSSVAVVENLIRGISGLRRVSIWRTVGGLERACSRPGCGCTVCATSAESPSIPRPPVRFDDRDIGDEPRFALSHSLYQGRLILAERRAPRLRMRSAWICCVRRQT